MPWLPIETVPKDGTLVDLWVVDSNGNGSRELDFYWGEAPGLHGGGLENWKSDSEEFLNGHSLLSWWDPSSKLTHWMPTPKDPGLEDLRWTKAPAEGLEAAIAEFKETLPGWWFSICECQVSCDATCAPTTASPDIALVHSEDARFDSGFRVDLPPPSTLADALRAVMRVALVGKGWATGDPALKPIIDSCAEMDR